MYFKGHSGRKRGMYRAANRGESWATRIIEALKKNPLQGLLMLVYRNIDMGDLVSGDNPLLAMTSKKKDWSGKYIPIPLEYGNDSVPQAEGPNSAETDER